MDERIHAFFDAKKVQTRDSAIQGLQTEFFSIWPQEFLLGEADTVVLDGGLAAQGLLASSVLWFLGQTDVMVHILLQRG